MNCVAIIPARGGSKRLPRKNVLPYRGLPMIAWSIRAAQEADLFRRIIVSTDDQEIADIARAHGAEVPFMRRADLADDHTGTTAVVADAIKRMEERPDWVCCLYATAPFMEARDVRKGFQKLRTREWDYVFSATTFASCVLRAFQMRGEMQMLFPEHQDKRTQDLPEVWHDAAQFYWGPVESWLTQRPIFGPNSAIVPIPRWRVQDLDTPEDWKQLLSMNFGADHARYPSLRAAV